MVAFTFTMLIPALIMGVFIGAWETYFMIKDMNSVDFGSGIAHAFGAFIQVIILVFFVMHQKMFLQLFPSIKTVPIIGFFVGSVWGFKLLIGAIEYFFLEFKSRVLGGRTGKMAGFHEDYFHVILIILATVFSPELWALIKPFLPWKF